MMFKILKYKNFLIILFILFLILFFIFLFFKIYNKRVEYKLLFLKDLYIKSYEEIEKKGINFKTLDELIGPKEIDFLNNIREDFLNNRVSFIDIDLNKMRLNMYIDGVLKESFNILSKGKDGSWWETPTGLYKIESKIKNHFSSFGGVYMPYSLNFNGNFFIHGWPYYPNGLPVARGYSGGCIRLSNDDAKKVFEMALIGMPVLVYESLELKDDFVYEIIKPNVDAVSYLAVDLNNNFILASKNKDNTYPIASIVKLLTAITAVEYINIEKEIIISSDMIIPTSYPRLKINQRYRLYDLLYLLLLESSNEAAKSISYFLGEDYFIKLINQKAKSLGMNQTVISDSSGISSQNLSSASDLFLLAKYLYNSRSFILNLTSNNLKNTIYGPVLFNDLKNFNFIVNNEKIKFIGGKIGKTSLAGETYLGVFEIELNKGKRPIAIIVLNSKDVKKDIINLFDYIFKIYE